MMLMRYIFFEVRTEFFKYYLDELRLQMVNSWRGQYAVARR
jgi:hypothetical protein